MLESVLKFLHPSELLSVNENILLYQWIIKILKPSTRCNFLWPYFGVLRKISKIDSPSVTLGRKEVPTGEPRERGKVPITGNGSCGDCGRGSGASPLEFPSARLNVRCNDAKSAVAVNWFMFVSSK